MTTSHPPGFDGPALAERELQATREITAGGGGDFFELSPDPLALVERDGCGVRWNPAWERAVGRTAVLREVVAVIHPADRGEALRCIHDLSRGATIERTLRCRGDAPHPRCWRWRVVPAARGVFCITLRDPAATAPCAARPRKALDESERRRIARLVHDTIQQLVTAALLSVRMLKGRNCRPDPAEELDNIEQMLVEAIRSTRVLADELGAHKPV